MRFRVVFVLTLPTWCRSAHEIRARQLLLNQSWPSGAPELMNSSICIFIFRSLIKCVKLNLTSFIFIYDSLKRSELGERLSRSLRRRTATTSFRSPGVSCRTKGSTDCSSPGTKQSGYGRDGGVEVPDCLYQDNGLGDTEGAFELCEGHERVATSNVELNWPGCSRRAQPRILETSYL